MMSLSALDSLKQRVLAGIASAQPRPSFVTRTKSATILRPVSPGRDPRRAELQANAEQSNEYKAMNEEQRNAFTLLASGRNVFLTGGGGVGKSFVVSQFIKQARSVGLNVVACAPTGVAAINMGDGASTIHRAMGIPFADYYVPSPTDGETIVALAANGNRELRPNDVVRNADVFIVDEISMCRIDLFAATMSLIANGAAIARSPRQVIVVGDFFQLPPVVKRRDIEVLSQAYPEFVEGWSFESRWWTRAGFAMVELTESVRQSEEEFVENLRKARFGDASCLPFFTLCVGTPASSDAVRLVSTNRKADSINRDHVERLGGYTQIYYADIAGTVKESDKNAPDVLIIKRGMRVMVTANSMYSLKDYQNGSTGTVVGFNDREVFVRLDGSKTDTLIEKATIQVTRPKVEIDENGRKKFATEVIGTFTQFPLRPAYAITIHKSQGKTYDDLIVSPECFAAGQLYVALSRATSVEGLHIEREISESLLFSSDAVKEFYRRNRQYHNNSE